jgi:predicted DNA binding CopG/RHH family protein
MKISFEKLAKDKAVALKISPELISATTEAAEKIGVVRVRFVREAIEEYLKLSQTKKLRKFTSKFEHLPQNGKLGMRISTALAEEMKKVAETNGRSMFETFREAIERAL